MVETVATSGPILLGPRTVKACVTEAHATAPGPTERNPATGATATSSTPMPKRTPRPTPRRSVDQRPAAGPSNGQHHVRLLR